MLATFATLLLTAFTATGGTDTTFHVRPGARLSVSNFGGGIAVNAWRKNAVRIAAEHSPRVQVVVVESGPNIDVRGATRRGTPARIEYSISVPEWMPLQLQGVYTDIQVKGMKSDLSAETVKGEVHVEGGSGFVRLSSVEGAVYVSGTKGRLELSSINEGVAVIGAEGEILVNAVNGDIEMRRVNSELVEASTVNGDVVFVGDLRSSGRYNFSTHAGDLVLGVPDDLDATVSIATFSGGFESGFPVQIERGRRGRRFNFTLGTGGARVNLESFEGTIHLKRAVDVLERTVQRTVPRLRELQRSVRSLERLRRVEKLHEKQKAEDEKDEKDEKR